MSDIHIKLRERLDMFPQGFPKTASGVELEILEDLFFEEDARIALQLRPFPEPVSVVAERLSMDEKILGDQLFDMSRGG
jgi:electron transport complex protein RnfB